MRYKLSPSPSSGAEIAATLRVLVVDDDPYARDLMSVTLTGWALELAETGADALNKTLPDLAIVDVQLPDMSGVELCRTLKERAGSSFLPVILITSEDKLCNKTDGLNFGADDYISKPFVPSELDAQVRALLRIKMLTDQLRNTQDLLAEKERELIAAQVAGAAAHELGQPITSLLLSCELLSRAGRLDAPAREVLETIQTECARIRMILGQLNRLDRYRTKAYVRGTEILDLDIPL